MKVYFAPRARRRALVVARWWRANRPAAPRLFDEELEQAKQALLNRPDIGQAFEVGDGRIVRRLLLPKTEQHLYYSVDENAAVVVVHTIWGARRGRAPQL